MPISLIKEEERHILNLLPVLLKKDSQFRTEIYTILIETFATKEDFARILEEIRLSREETNKRFAQMQQQMDRRFEQMQQQMDKRFEQVDKRLEQIDKRIDIQVEEFRLHREESNKRFDEQGKVIASLSNAVERLGMSIRTLGARWGTEAEVTIRKTLQELLLKNLKITQVSEWKAKDKEGRVGAPNAEIQIDLLMRNGEHYLVEIKSSADSAHVERLYKIGQFYTEKVKIKPKLLFVAVTMKKTGIFLCDELGIQLITYDELSKE